METKVVLEHRGDWDYIFYSGPFNEETGENLLRKTESARDRCAFNFKNLATINSSGVGGWLSYIENFQQGRKIVFEECPPEFVYQVNMISTFKGTGKIRSVFGVMTCDTCEFKKSKLFQDGLNLPPSPEDLTEDCPKCAGQLNLNEDPTDFFRFCEHK